MADKEIQLSKNVKTLAKSDKKHTGLVEMVEELSLEPVCEPRCKLCNSDLRHEAETMYDKVHNYSAVCRFLKEKGADVSEAGVKHHLREHYGQDIRNLKMKEYSKDLNEKWINVHLSEEERIHSHLAIIDQQIHQTMAMTDKSDIIEVRKSNDSVTKMMDAATKLNERLGEINKGIEPARILVQKFKDIVLIQTQNITSLEAKKALVDILQSLENEVEGMKFND